MGDIFNNQINTSGESKRNQSITRWLRATLAFIIPGMTSVMLGTQANAYDFCATQPAGGDIAWDLEDNGNKTIPFSFTAGDVWTNVENVGSASIRGKHQYTGDMAAELRSPSGTNVVLFRLGDGRYGEGASGCFRADFDITFSDTHSGPDLSVSSEGTYCTGSNNRGSEGVWPQPYLPNFPNVGSSPAINGTVRTYNSQGMSSNLLSNFVGDDPLSGSWGLYVEDAYAQDVGTVEEACLDMDFGSVTYDIWVSSDANCADQLDTATFDEGDTVNVCYVVSNEATQDFNLQSETNDHGQALTELNGAYSAKLGGSATVKTAVRTFTAGDGTLPVGTTELSGDVTVEGTDSHFSAGETLTTNEKVTITVRKSSLAIDKAAPSNADEDGSSSVTLGDTLTYVITVTNDGQVGQPDVVITDPKLTPDTQNCGSLANGQSCTLTGTYTVTQADVDAGQILNTASVVSSKITTPLEDTETTPVAQTDSLAIDKPAPANADGDSSGDVSVGDVLTYTITATNDGTTTLNNVVVSDPLTTPSSTTCTTLAPGATCVLTGTYTVTQADVDAGSIVNTASVESTEITTPVTEGETTPVAQTDSLAIDKPAPANADGDSSGDVSVGDVLTYTITATNDGTTTQSNVTVTDSMISPNTRVCTSLAPGATCSLTGTYTVTQADVDAGSIVNTAGVTSDDITTAVEDVETTPVAQTDSLAIDKPAPANADGDSSGDVSVGDVLTYTITATNDGTTTQSNVVVSDPMISPSSTTCTTLAPGATCVLTGTYTVTQADVDAGSITNTAGVTSDDITTAVEDGNVQTIVASPELSMTKTAVETNFTAVGDTISYNYEVTNTGNVSITGLSVTDDKIATVTCPVTSLAPGASTTCTATYTVTQADLDAGSVTNNADADATPSGGTLTPAEASETVNGTQSPALSVEKTSVDTTFAAVGDLLEYEYKVTNTGNVTVTDPISVNDDKIPAPAVVSCPALPMGGLAPNEFITCTASYSVTQTDIDAGSVTNVATATDGTTTSPSDSVTVDATQTPELTMVKSAIETSYTAVGDILNYEYSVENTGNVAISDIAVTDDRIDTVSCLVTGVGNGDANLDPGETVVCTANYTVTQADLDAGSVTNNASVTGTPTGGSLTDATAQETVNADQQPALTMAKASLETSYAAVGDVLNYEYTVENTGNVYVSNISVTDDKIDSVTCDVSAVGNNDPNLDPGEIVVCTASYTVTQADIDAGSVTNNASVTGDPSGGTLTDATAQETVDATQNPAMEVVKTATDVQFELPGDVTTYDYVVTNTGNTTITDPISVNDNLITSVSCPALPAGGLAPNASLTCTASYTVTQADLDAGSVTNLASATDGTTTSPQTSETIPADQSPALSIAKAALFTEFTTAGEVVEYEYTVTNTGNLTLTGGVNVVDDKIGTISCVTGNFIPGAVETCRASYTITQADIDAGSVTNQAYGQNGSLVSAPVDVTVNANQTPSVDFVKRATTSSFTQAGDVLSYEFDVTNSGNVTLIGLSLSDDLTSVSCPQTSLAPSASMMCTASYTVTQADVDAGEVVNNASITAVPPSGTSITETSTATVDSSATSSLSFAKRALDTSFATAGDVLDYAFDVENTGTITLSAIAISDDLATVSCPFTTLAPAQTMVCNASYTVTQADIDAGSVTNNASIASELPDGSVGPDSTDSAVVNAALMPELTVDKVALGASYASVGDVLSYTYAVTNTGNVTVSAINVTDDLIPALSCPATTLSPNASMTCTGDYTVTQADIDAGSVTNTATATGTPSGGTLAPATDMETVNADQMPSLATVKTAMTADYDAVGDVVSYEYEVTNTGNVTITDAITVSDDKIASVNCPALPSGGLAPNAAITCTATYVVTQADIDAGSVTNTASATDGTTTSPDVSETVNAVQTPSLAMTKTASPQTYAAVGDVVSYDYVVTNTGNVTFTDAVSVSDDKISSVTCPALPAGGLAPNASLTCTATYTVTQADLDAGSVTNLASASSGATSSPDVSETVTADQMPSLSVDKTAVNTSYAATGDVLDYNYLVTNTGNVTITDAITVSDDLIASVSCPALPATGLAPNATLTCTASYTVTQADIDAGSVTNIASASDGNVTSPTDSATVNADQMPSLTMVKTALTTAYASPGDVLSYEYEVTNTGNVTMTGVVTVSDDLIDTVACPALPFAGLAPNASITCTATYVATQADIDTGSVTNIASASNGSTLSPTDSATVNATQAPALTVVKDADAFTFAMPGDVINYTYEVINAGNTTITNAISVADDKTTVACPALPAGGLAPMASLTCTASYAVTQADIDAGEVTNLASATDGLITSPQVSETVIATQDPSMSVVKTATSVNFVLPGDVTTYEYVITNNGNVTITDPVTITDNRIASVSCPALPAGGLAPNAAMTCTATYTATQDDLDQGSVTNIATASDGTTTSDPVSETIPASQAPALTIRKSSTDTTYAAVGEVLSYTYEVENTGNVTLTGDISVVDDKIGTFVCFSGNLVPGGVESCVETYTVTQADIDNGEVTNNAYGDHPRATSAPVAVTIPADQMPELSLLKEALTADFDMAGETLDYRYTVTNTGNTTIIYPIDVDDNRIPNVTCPALPAGGLLPGANMVCTGSDTVTQADVDSGSVTNTATATDGQTTSSPPQTATVNAVQTPSMGVQKLAGDSAYAAVGDELDYTYIVTNTGNVTLTDAISVTDSRIDNVSCPALPAGGLLPGATITCTATDTVTQADLDAGSVMNTASATDGTTTSGTVDVTVEATQEPALEMTKTAREADFDAAGDTVTYDYVVTNTGNVTLTNAITVSDDKIASVSCPALPVGGLAPTASLTCSATYTVTQADMDAGSVTNLASASDGSTTSPQVSETVDAVQSSGLAMTKTAVETSYAAVGETLTYNYLVTNTGNVSITSDITVTDDRIATVTCPALPAGGLAPSASITCTATDTVSQADIDAGSVTNTAAASDGTTISPSVSETVTADQNVGFTVDKQAVSNDFSAVGDVLSYAYILENTGNVSLTETATIADDKIGTITCPAMPSGGLVPGATLTCEADYTVTQADLDTGSVTNIASATIGTETSANDTVTIEGTQAPELTIAKSSNASPFTAVGEIVSYEYVVSNSGNVTITAPVTVSDDKIATVNCPALPSGGLAPMASITCSADYAVTQADLDNGSVTNIASASDGTTVSETDSVTVDAAQQSGLSIAKSSLTTSFNMPGDIVSYEYVVTNTGNVTLTDAISVADDKISDVTCPALPSGGLAPQATLTCSADYTVTQSDIDNGSVTNIATASAGNTTSPADEVTVEASREPELSVTKSVTETVQVGGPIYDVTYEIAMENTGNVTLTDLQLQDDLATALSPATIYDVPTVQASGFNSGSANTAYDGASNLDLLANNPMLMVGESGLVTLQVRVDTTNGGPANANTAIGNAPVLSSPVPSNDPMVTPDNSSDVNPTPLVINDLDGDGVNDLLESASEDRDGDGIPDQEDYDPTGYFYCEENGRILTGGGISVSGPAGSNSALGTANNITIVQDGSNGYYQFYVTAPGRYTLSPTYPDTGAPSTRRPVQNVALDVTSMLPSNPGILGSSEFGDTGELADFSAETNTPFYFTFDIEAGDPSILMNNIPLQHCGSSELSLSKTVAADPVTQDNGQQLVSYNFTVTNTGETRVDDIQIIDDLGSVYGPANITIGTNSIIDEPINYAGGLNEGFDGVTDIEVLNGLGELEAGKSLTVNVQALVTPETASTFINKATVQGGDPLDGSIVLADDTASIQLVPAAKVSDLVVRKVARPRTVQIGDPILYTIEVMNTGLGTVTDIDIVDNIPAGFAYIPNSATVSDGTDSVKLEPEMVTAGQLSWGIANMNASPLDYLASGETVSVNLRLLAGPNVDFGQHENQAWAQNNDTGERSAIATASVDYIPEPTFDCTPVLGRVYDDVNHNGYPDDGEPGLPGVRLVTVNGDIITTDGHGRYHIPCAMIADSENGSNFLLKADVRTLPLGFATTTENPRVVRATRGKFVKLNFGAAFRPKLRIDLFEQDYDRGLMTAEAASRIRTVMNSNSDAERALVIYHASDDQSVDQAQANLTLAMKVIEELAPKALQDVALEASWGDAEIFVDERDRQPVQYDQSSVEGKDGERVTFKSNGKGGLDKSETYDYAFDVKGAMRGQKGSKPLTGDERERSISLAGRQDRYADETARPGRLQRWVGWADSTSSYAEGPELETTVDALDPVKRLNAQADIVATEQGRMIMAEAYHNYAAFTDRLEVRVFDADRSVRGTPLAVLAVTNGKASGALGEDWPEELSYVLRAYGSDGDFDETALKSLHNGDAEYDLSMEDWAQQAYTAFGQNTLVKNNVTTRGGAVRVYGRNIAGGTALVMGQTVRVDESGRFVSEQILPKGEQQVAVELAGVNGTTHRMVRMVEVKDRDTFYVAQIEATVGERPSSDDTFTEGRVAFYVRSRLNDRWAFTATADTGEAEIGDLLNGLDDKDVSQLLRRLDPDKYYPVYGDDSTIEQDAPTSGRIYARLERDDDYLLWGNYQTNFSDTEYGRIQRTLYGAKLHWDENNATKFGDARTEVTAFLAEGGTRQGRDELQGTGGSIYYLRHGDVSIGSEIVRVETRDVVSGLVIESRRMSYGTDYDMDFIQGRILLNRPLSSTANDGRLFRDGSQSGHETVLVVDYEFSLLGAGDDSSIYGARASRWFNDLVKVGVTYNHGDDGGVESDLYEADLTLQLAAGTYIKGEIAQTEGAGVETYRSDDGGFTYARRDRGGLANDAKAMAYAIEAATDLSDYFDADGRVYAYWRKREAGFAGYAENTNQSVEQYGGGMRLDVFEDFSLNARADIFEDQTVGTNSFAEASAEYALNDNVKLSGGVSYNDNGTTSGTSIGGRAEYAFNNDAHVYVFGQAGLEGDNARTTDRAGVGGELRIGKRLLAGGEVSGGEDGLGARLSARVQSEDGDEYYAAYDLPLQSQVASNMGTFNLGARRRFSDALSVYGEERMQFNERGLNGVTHAYGVEYKPGKWNLNLSGELGRVNDLDREAISAGVGFKDDHMQAGITSEFRQDKNVLTGEDRRTWLLRSTALYQMSDELRLQGKFNMVKSDLSEGTSALDFNEAEFTEASIAAAYRPVWDDRFNLLAKAVYLYDLSPSSQRFGGESVNYRQKSTIYSVDGSYDIHPRWTLGAKYGHRSGEVTDSRESDDFYKSSADLGVIRLDYHLTHRWDATLEGRYLSIGDGTVERTGGLAALYRHINDNAKIGVGLTYGGIEQEYLLARDDEDIGWLVNVVGKF